MTQIKIKRVYDDPEESDGYRVLVDRLWPRGIKKEYLKYNAWEKGLTPSPDLRKWFHEDIPGHWQEFSEQYNRELDHSKEAQKFLKWIRNYDRVTLLYASKEPEYNHARLLQAYLIKHL